MYTKDTMIKNNDPIPINQISRFLIKPTSQNLIKLFENFKTKYVYSYNYKELDKSLEKIIKKLKFDHDNLNEFKEELWQQLAYFEFDYIIWSTLADEIEDGSNDKPIAEHNENIAKNNNEKNENDNYEEAQKLISENTNDYSIDNITTAAYKFAKALDADALEFKDNKLNRPLRFFSSFENIYENNVNDINFKRLSEKNLEFSNILVRLITEEKNEYFESLDKKSSYHDERYKFPDESIHFLSAIILKFFDLGTQKDKNKESSKNDGEYIEKRIDLVFELLILQLIFGKYHHKKLCQIFTNNMMKNLDIEKDVIFFNNSYSSFIKDPKIQVILQLFFNPFICNFYLRGIPNAAITILFREMHELIYENPLKSDRNFPVIHFCAKLCLLIQQTRCLVSPDLEPSILKVFKKNPNQSSDEFYEKWGEWLADYGLIFLDYIVNKIGEKKLAKMNKDKLKIDEDLRTYICPSIAFDIAQNRKDISDLINFSMDQSEDDNDYSYEEYDQQKIIIAFLEFEKSLNNKYDVNPFPVWSKTNIESLRWFFDADGYGFLHQEPSSKKNLTENIFCLPYWLESYYMIDRLDKNNIFEKYLTIFDYETFKKNGLENYLPLCFVINFFNLIIHVNKKKCPKSKIYFNIEKFRELYDFMKSSSDYASENIFFENILSYYIESEYMGLGLLQENFLNQINEDIAKSPENIAKSPEKSNLYQLDNTKNKQEDNYFLKKINAKEYIKLKNIEDDLKNIDFDSQHNVEIENKLMQLRKILEAFIPERIQSLISLFNDSEDILKIAKMKRVKTSSLGATSIVLRRIIKLNEYQIKEIQKKVPKGIRSNLKSINSLNDNLIKYDFPKIINILNTAAHHTNKKQEFLKNEVNEVLDFMLDKDKLYKIINALL